MHLKDWLSESINRLNKAGISSSRLDCLIMLEKVLEKDRSSILANDTLDINPHIKKLNIMLGQREKRIPLAYIIGEREFYGLNIKVDESVLVPRPETEDMVTKAIEIAPNKGSVLELGTGSGAVSLALASERSDLKITATDISDGALETARLNANNLQLEIELVASDLFANIEEKYDLILANLPYVPVEARRQAEIEHEPDVALYGGEDGLDYYRTFFDQVDNYLSGHGTIIVEFSPTQFAAVRELAHEFAIEPISEYIYFCKKA